MRQSLRNQEWNKEHLRDLSRTCVNYARTQGKYACKLRGVSRSALLLSVRAATLRSSGILGVIVLPL